MPGETGGVELIGVPGCDTCVLTFFKIDTHLRGVGLGRSILGAILKWYRLYGTRRMCVCASSNDGALFYRALGFRRVNGSLDFFIDL